MLLLLAAVVVEVGATTVLPRARGFTDPGWSLVVLAGYALSIWMLTVVVRQMPVSVAYALWAGLGTALVAIVGWLALGEAMTPMKALFLLCVVVGVVGLNLVGTH